MAGRPLSKRLLSSPLVIWPLALLITGLLRLIYLTCRVEKRYDTFAREVSLGLHPAMVCFWHGRIAMQPFSRAPFMRVKRPVHAIASRSRDGKMMATVLRCFNIGPILGSRSKGATGVTIGMLEVTKRGDILAIAPDGPRGPHQKAAPGATFIASKSGYPILPLSFSATRYWRFRSWDKFLLPKPFARILILAGEAITVPPDANDATLAAATQLLEDAMTALTAQADAECGVPA